MGSTHSSCPYYWDPVFSYGTFMDTSDKQLIYCTSTCMLYNLVREYCSKSMAMLGEFNFGRVIVFKSRLGTCMLLCKISTQQTEGSPDRRFMRPKVHETDLKHQRLKPGTITNRGELFMQNYWWTMPGIGCCASSGRPLHDLWPSIIEKKLWTDWTMMIVKA